MRGTSSAVHLYHLLNLELLPAQALAVHLRHQWIPWVLKVKGGKATQRVLGLAVSSLALRLLHQQHRLLSTNNGQPIWGGIPPPPYKQKPTCETT
jgi:hypothetical protein